MRIHRRMDGKKAKGINEVSKVDYESKVDENIKLLVRRMKNQSYKPLPSKRVYIEKAGSSKKKLPSGDKRTTWRNTEREDKLYSRS